MNEKENNENKTKSKVIVDEVEGGKEKEKMACTFPFSEKAGTTQGPTFPPPNNFDRKQPRAFHVESDFQGQQGHDTSDGMYAFKSTRKGGEG